jgi:hypothetical protein
VLREKKNEEEERGEGGEGGVMMKNKMLMNTKQCTCLSNLISFSRWILASRRENSSG